MREIVLLLLASGLLLLPTSAGAAPKQPDPQLQARVTTLLVDVVDRAQLDFFAGTEAERCVPSSSSTELCQWNLGNRNSGWKALAGAIETDDRIALVCQLPKDGGMRALDSCNAYPMRSNRDQFQLQRRKGKKMRSSGEIKRQRAEYQKIAASWIGAARTLPEMTQLMGAAPDRCVPTRGTELACRWKASARVYGQGTLAAWIEVSARKRIRFDCIFPVSGEAREQVCSAEIGS